VPGSVLAVGGLVGIVYGFSEASTSGWGSGLTVGPLAGGVLLLAAFVLVERRSAHPLLPLGVVADRVRGTAYLAVLFVAGAVITGLLHPSRATIDTANSGRGPLLLVMGGRDHTVPEAITKATLKQYRDSDAVTDLVEFPDRGHSLTIDSGWRAVADESLSWLAKQGL
jgi:pimeloyl-ACP methyl ester carboxylesterase